MNDESQAIDRPMTFDKPAAVRSGSMLFTVVAHVALASDRWVSGADAARLDDLQQFSDRPSRASRSSRVLTAGSKRSPRLVSSRR